MKKSTINTILISVIALMSVSICFLIFCIATRPRYVIVSEPQTETAVITEMSGIAEDLQSETASAPVDVVDSAIDGTIPSDDMQGKTSTRVNIRNAASADAKVLDTVKVEPPSKFWKSRTMAGLKFNMRKQKHTFLPTMLSE